MTDQRSSRIDLLVAGIAAAIGAVAVGQSWNRWLDPIVDAGRDLYIPGAMLHGVRLYGDIRYFYPPLTPLLLAAVTAMTGDSLGAFIAIGLTIALATAAALIAIGRAAGSPLAGSAAAALFAACCVAGPATWGCNYIFPYAHAATLAMLLFLGELAFLCAHLFGGRGATAALLAVVCALAAAWTKVEFAPFGVLLLALAIVLYGMRPIWAAAYAAGAALSFAGVAVVFRGTDWLRGNVLPDAMLGNAHLAAFYRVVGGFDRIPELFLTSAFGAALIALVILLLRYASARSRWSGAAMSAAILLAGAVALTDLFFTAWTVLQLVLVPLAFRRREGPLSLLLAASLCASARVFFHLVPRWYGFVFVVPLLVLMAYVLLEWLPAAGVYTRKASLVWLAAMSVVAAHWLWDAHGTYARRSHPILTPRGTVMDASADRAAILTRQMGALRTRGVRSLVVMPEGLALNYLYRIPLPIAFHTFTPAETADPRAEAAVVEELATKQPPWIAFVQRDVAEFGSAGFGRDYDQRLSAWIGAHYVVRSVERGRDFGFALLERK